ncbi:flavin reductase family protein [Vibrio genomosp. F10]|uniref:Flavin oxidoreductase n=1 Tax=Vibrio genomosp. F10 TaxID=723171 RepID=A0A1B9QYQ7_9VIBR|nr:flavin reductase [Vibrio genomosp. F10]OCH75772.1 flavin oxidoreductase [Vibrio genomosp. F10]
MKHINTQQLTEMNNRYRAHLINSLSGFKSANLIGSVNTQGQTNVAMFSSVIHLGASPALVGFIIRPASVPRHTLDNILETKQYTINQVSEEFYIQAHQTSARYSREHSEFQQTGLQEQYIHGYDAPFVKESMLKYALTLREIVPIALNNTQLVIGEITDILCPETVIQEEGYIDIESLKTTSISGLDNYHTSHRLSRLSYAKTDSMPRSIALDGAKIATTS